MQRTKIISILLFSTALAGGWLQKSGSKIIQNNSEMIAKTLFKPSTLHMLAEYADVRSALKARLIHKQCSKLKVSGKLDVFPNDGPVKLIFDTITNEFTWEDENDSIPENKKQKIVSAMILKGIEMSNELFDTLYMSSLTMVFGPFQKEVLLEMATHFEISRHSGADRDTPLMLAARYDAEKAVAKLIERGAKTNIRNLYGQTALHYIAYHNSILSCKILLEKGAYVNTQEATFGETPLMAAARLNHIDMVKLLLKHGASTTITGRCGGDALQLSQQLPTPECSNIIKDHREKYEQGGCIIL